VYSHLRIATSTSLIAFGIVIGVDGLALLAPAVEGLFVTKTEISNPTEMDCAQPSWWHFGRNCLSRRGMTWITEYGLSKVVTVDEVNNAPKKPLTETQPAATTVETTDSVQQTEVTLSSPEMPVQLWGTEERHLAQPPTEVKTRRPVQKKVARRAKRPPNEALSAVRKFGDNLHDIPVTAYAAHGTPRRVIIRPTSKQDVYYYYYYNYYSTPR
jgi:hypothetical protein